MKALRTVSIASRSVRILLVSIFAAALLASVSLAGMKPVSLNGTGSALALITQMHTARAQVNLAGGTHHTPAGRTLLNRAMMHAGAIFQPRVAANNVVPISSAVQTYDIFNPPPAFRPEIGFGSRDNLNNDSTNPPVYVPNLLPANLTPVWSRDESFIIYSSNRDSDKTNVGGVEPDGRFHLWAISVNGGEAFQITTSLGPNGGGEFFPALSVSNNALTFTSDAQSPGIQNLYAIQSNSAFSRVGAFSFATLVSLNNKQAFVNVDDPNSLIPLTIRSGDPNATTTVNPATTIDPNASPQFTGFSQVQRPTFSPSEQTIVFSALGATGTNANHYHLYSLNTNTRGFDVNSASYPAKLTDGPTDDTDPAYSPDGQFVAFASTATSIATRTNNDPANGLPTNQPGPNPPGAVQPPNNSQTVTVTSIPAAPRSIFLLSGGASVSGAGFGTVVTSGGQIPGGRVTLAGTDNYGPAWSNFANQNQYTNPAGNFGYLAFARSAAPSASTPDLPHDIVYLQIARGISQPNTQTLTPESGGNAVITLNTDDNAGQTSAGGNIYDDVYPAWSPFLSIFSITYQSGNFNYVSKGVTRGRTVTYNAPATGNPTEVAVSIPDGGQALNPDGTTSYTVGQFYTGILVSQVLNLDPPTLLRFGPDEVMHVQAVGPDPVRGTPDKLAGSSASRAVTLTVRLSDREAGIDDTGGPNGGPRVYVQIKNPNSKYQGSDNAEHKVFAKDRRYDFLTGATAQSNHPSNDITSGTLNSFMDDYGFDQGQNNPLIYGAVVDQREPTGGPLDYRYPSYATGPAGEPVFHVIPRGVHSNFWGTPNQTTGTYVFIGKDAGGTNPGLEVATAALPGGDPRRFIPQGPEYECELVNPQFATSSNANAPANPTPLATRFASTVTTPGATVGDYLSPYWLAGVDDQSAFSGGLYTSNTGSLAFAINQKPNGSTQTDRPIGNYTTNANNNTTQHPAEWLQLQRVPDAQQDNQGGVLYFVNWTAPASGSDFYADVIAYDKAVYPALPVGGANGLRGHKRNWRIYDNVGGFSTNASIGNNDILVVSDYALGQKFAATTFGGRNSNLNLVPKLFGTESYLTDIDVTRLPDSVYAGIPTSPTSYDFNPVLQLFTSFPNTGTVPTGFSPTTINGQEIRPQNGLGVGSYFDDVNDDGTRVSVTDDPNPASGIFSARNVQAQRYSIWRILSRGPVPQRVLNSYLPNPIQQPQVVDTGDPSGKYRNVPAATVLDANKCVIWLSPYTGDVLADPGTIDDPGTVNGVGRNSTTTNLTAFVKAGGRLCITGQDVGSTLTQGGTLGNAPSGNPNAPSFLPDVLNAQLAGTGTAVRTLVGPNGAQNRILGNSQYDNSYQGRFLSLDPRSAFTPPGYFNNENNYIFSFFPYQDNLVIANTAFGDAGFSQLNALTLPTGASIQGQPDTITPVNGGVTAATYNDGTVAMVYHDDPFNKPAGGAKLGQLPNGGTGSRVVYAAFGLESLTNDFYAPVAPSNDNNINPNSPAYDMRIPAVQPRNMRAEILHNIVNFLRTGQVTGTITQTAGTGQGGGLGIDGVTVYLQPITGQAPPTRVTFSALTANGGRFTISGVEPGTYVLAAVKPGFQRAVSNSGTAFTVEGDVTVPGKTLTLTPLPPGSIAGIVKDTAGNAISGATIKFTSQDNSVTLSITTPSNIPASVNPKDNYYLQSVPVTTYTGLATGPNNPNGKPEYQSAAGTPSVAPDVPNDQGFAVPSSPTVDGVNFTLTPILASISGRIFDNTSTDDATGGALTAGAIVTLTDAAGKTVATTTAVADGTYTFTNVPTTQVASTFTVTATKVGYKTTANTKTVANVYLGDMVTGQDIGLAPIPPGVLTGQVTDAQTGTGVAGALVNFTSTDGTTKLPQATADANGFYTINNVPPGDYNGTATGPNNPNGRPTAVGTTSPAVTVNSAPPPTTVNFQVTIVPPSFSGTVTDNATPAKPLASVLITVTDTATGRVVLTTKTKADGTYATGPLPEGTYTLSAKLVGFMTGTIIEKPVYNGDALTGQDFFLTTVLPGSISGQVTDQQTGGPVVGATVSFTSTDGTVTLPSVTTDSNGNYSVPRSAAKTDPAGDYIGTATGPVNANGKPEYNPSAPQTITVPVNDTVQGVNFVLTEIPASLSGTVTDRQTGKPLGNVTLTLTDSTGKTVGTVKSASDGTYSFPSIPAGQSTATFTLSASAPSGYFPSTQSVSLGLGDQLTAVPVLLDELGTVTGLVTDASTSLPLSNVTLTVTDVTTGATVTTTPSPLITANGTSLGPDGKPANYTATFVLTPGHTYAVSAVKPNYNPPAAATPVTPSPLTNTQVGRADIQLTSSIATLGGLVTDATTNTPVGAATITVTNSSGSVVATFTTSGSVSAAPDGQTQGLNYSGQISQGTYTLTLTKGNRTPVVKRNVVVTGGRFNRVDFTGATGEPPLFTFAGGQLYFLSTPYDYSAIGFDAVFGNLNTAPAGTPPNGNRSHVAVWDPTVGQYILDPNAPADSLRLGVGYWIFLKSTVNITQQGGTPTTPYVPVPLHPSWNQLGVPNIKGVPVSSLMFDNGAGGMISFATAASSQYHLVSPTLYSFDGVGYQPVSQSSVLQPWKAYWIKVFANTTIEIPTALTTNPSGAVK